MTPLSQVKKQMTADPEHWAVALMDFVDDFRREKDPAVLSEPLRAPFDKWDILLASTASQLCDELGVTPPDWLEKVPACRDPWFPSGLENLKAITLVESPLHFRRHKIFVLENFLSRA